MKKIIVLAMAFFLLSKGLAFAPALIVYTGNDKNEGQTSQIYSAAPAGSGKTIAHEVGKSTAETEKSFLSKVSSHVLTSAEYLYFTMQELFSDVVR